MTLEAAVFGLNFFTGFYVFNNSELSEKVPKAESADIIICHTV